jgi:beta-lactamase superfamily II metal-dependent hydrolase
VGEGPLTAARSVALLLALSLAAAAPAGGQAIPDSTMVAHFIDVGQGDAALLEFSCGAMMIDAGGQAASDVDHLVDYLRAFFQRRTDLHSTLATILISHDHIDHTRGLRKVVETFHVENVVENGRHGAQGDAGDAGLVWLAAQRHAGAYQGSLTDIDEADVTGDAGLVTEQIDPVSCPGTDPAITVLSADYRENPGWTKQDFQDKNNQSIVARIDFGKSSFLFTGDLEAPAIATLLQFYANSPMLDADVYHVGHHGSDNATTRGLLNAIVKPKIAVISMGSCTRDEGQFNAFKFGHPRRSTVDMLRDAITRRRSAPKRVPVADGVEDFHQVTMRDAIYATGWDGSITIEATSGGRYTVNIEKQRDPPGCAAGGEP